MPSTRAENFKGGGGILRKKDGTILGIEFTPINPLFKDTAPKPGVKKSDFKWLYAVLTIQEDGREQVSLQPLKVGSVDDFEVVEDGRGVAGTRQFGKGSEFGTFLETLYKPLDEGEGFDPERFPEDPEGLVADFTNIAGARVQFDWQLDESKWGKAHPRKAKDKDGKPLMKDGKQVTYPAELLVVRSYYGQVEVGPAASKPKPGGAAARSAGTTAKKAAAKPAVDVAALAGTKVVAALLKVKGNATTIQKLNVKLLQEMAEAEYADTREPVRAWALKGENVATIPGVTYDTDSKVVSYEAPETDE